MNRRVEENQLTLQNNLFKGRSKLYNHAQEISLLSMKGISEILDTTTLELSCAHKGSSVNHAHSNFSPVWK